MDKVEVEKIIRDEIKIFVKDMLDKEIARILRERNSKTRQEIVAMMKDGLEAVFKTLWQKRDFWKTDIR